MKHKVMHDNHQFFVLTPVEQIELIMFMIIHED